MKKPVLFLVKTFIDKSKACSNTVFALLTVFILIGNNQRAFAQTTLAQGDISLIGWGCTNTGAFDDRSVGFVTWVPLSPGTVIKFAMNTFNSASASTASGNANTFNQNVMYFTVTSGISAGSVVKIVGTYNISSSLIPAVTCSSGGGSVSIPAVGSGGNGNDFAPLTAGRAIFVYQGSNWDASNSSTATFSGTILYGLCYNGGAGTNLWLTTGLGTIPRSYQPGDLNNAYALNGFGVGVRSGYYSGTTSGFASLAAAKSAVNNIANWTTSTSTTATASNLFPGNFTLPVTNTAPTFTNSSPQTLTLCQNASATSVNSLLTTSDVDASQTETWSVTSSPSHGTLGGFNATASSGSSSITPTGLTYTPTNGYSGSDQFIVQVSDGTATASMTVNVTVNSLPTITLGTNPSVCNGITSTSLTYSATTNSPNQYSIAWSAGGIIAGFSNVGLTSLPASPISMTVPSNPGAGSYTGTMIVKNSTTGCSSASTAMSVIVNGVPTITLSGTTSVSNGTTSASQTYSATTNTPNQYGITWNGTAATAGFVDVTQGTTLPVSPITLAVPSNPGVGTYTGTLYVKRSSTGCISTGTSISVNVTQPPPTITSISSLIAAPSTAITITGSNFDATASNNAVYFGSTRGSVTAASTTSLTVTVPGGATYDRVTVVNLTNALTGFAQYSSLSTFTASSATPSFGAATNTTSGTNPFDIVTGDLDGDGKPDIAVTNGQGGNWTTFLNTSTLGTISYASPQTYTEGVSGKSMYGLAIGDLNRDGKLDIVVAARDSSKISVYINTSTVGNISFATRVKYAVTHPWQVKIADLDLDGRPDIIVAGDEQQKFSYFRNIYNGSGVFNSTSFATKVDVSVPGSQFLDALAVGDIDGDGKPDVVAGAQTTNVDNLQVFRNTSSGPGFISFASAVTSSSAQYIYYLAVGDLDGNGKADIIAGNNGASYLTVLPNTSTSGSISFGTALQLNANGGGYGVTLADFTGHGKPDIAYVNSDGSSYNVVSIYRNTSTSGNISFSSNTDFVSISSQCWGIVATDMDGDNKPDMIVANYQGTNFSSYRNTIATASTPTFTNSSPQSFAICQNAGATSINSLLTISDTQPAKTDTWTVTSAPTHGTLSSFTGATHASGSTSISPTALTYTATTGYSGADAFTVQVSDGAATATMVVNVTVTPLTVISTTANQTHDVANASGNYTAGICNIISTVQPWGGSPVAGNITAKVWIESSVPVYNSKPYVARHYEITPAINPTTSTGTVTLYYLQSEFDDYNAAPGSVLDLPSGPSDATGIGNLRINKYSGTSSDNSGLPASYTNGSYVIDPDDNNIVWNAAAARWEVTFNVTGFSGFFAQTNVFTLPVTWVSFTAEKFNQKALLKWQTATETNNSHFVIEYSTDGRNFTTVGSVTAVGNSNSLRNYSFIHETPQKETNYYRIKQVDNNGNSNYSEIRMISFNANTNGFMILINPVTSGKLQVQFNKASGITIYDTKGQLKLRQQINAGSQTINVSSLSQGTYILKAGSEAKKFIVE